MAPQPPQQRVCVTGAGGFIASWLVKLLLSRGYAVHATVRDPDHPKNAFLKRLDGASENLRLFKADVLDYDTLTVAFAGCEGVFHPASPVPGEKHVDPEKEMMAPTVKGSENVLEACSATNVQKLVVVSSLASVCLNPSWPEDTIKDESCWSDKGLCREIEIWYALAKTEAEEMALEYGAKNGLNVVTVLPGLAVGPLLQTELINTSVKVLQYVIKGGPDTMNNKFWSFVHVHDVADALLLVYEKPESSGRYICALEQMDMKDVVKLLKSRYPDYDYVDKTVDVDYNLAVSSEKLRNLGWKPRSLEETLADGLEYLEKAGLLDQPCPCRLPKTDRTHRTLKSTSIRNILSIYVSALKDVQFTVLIPALIHLYITSPYQLPSILYHFIQLPFIFNFMYNYYYSSNIIKVILKKNSNFIFYLLLFSYISQSHFPMFSFFSLSQSIIRTLFTKVTNYIFYLI